MNCLLKGQIGERLRLGGPKNKALFEGRWSYFGCRFTLKLKAIKVHYGPQIVHCWKHFVSIGIFFCQDDPYGALQRNRWP